MDKLCLKIHLPDGEIPEREVIDETKRLKADGDYIDVGWRVLGACWAFPLADLYRGETLTVKRFTTTLTSG